MTINVIDINLNMISKLFDFAHTDVVLKTLDCICEIRKRLYNLTV